MEAKVRLVYHSERHRAYKLIVMIMAGCGAGSGANAEQKTQQTYDD